METVKDIIVRLEEASKKHNILPQEQLEWWCDYMLELFSTDGDVEHHNVMQMKNSELFHLSMLLLNREGTANDKMDLLGNLYEILNNSKLKVSWFENMFGRNLSVGVDENGKPIACTNTCGTGRQMIIHSMYTYIIHYYKAFDTKPLFVKICALNMFFHGLQGTTICYGKISEPPFERKEFGYEIKCKTINKI